MNERIEAYLKQHHCRDYFNCYGENVEDEHYFMYREEVDGLIELIVRKCANVALEQKKWVEDQIVFNPRDKEWNLARIQQSQHIVDKIKEHFGIEQ